MKKFIGNEDFDLTLRSGEKLFVLKHSSTCPVSQAAYEEYEKFASEQRNLHTYYLVVQEERPLSDYIAEKFHIKHESPQVILFKNGDVVWHASHWKITLDTLTKAIEENV